MKWTTFLSFTLIALVLFLAGWLSYIGYLTKTRNRACLVFTPENQRDTHSPIGIEFQGVINDYSSRNGGVGLQVTIIFPDDVIWNGVAGYADLGNRCPMTLQHHLYIGSMTKPFTATLVMEQVESGSLSLDDKVNSWIHPFPENNITVRHLLSHTSGLPDYARNTWFQIRWFGLPDKTWQPDELVRVIQDEPLRFPPGSRHEYSNSYYLLLGMILEEVAHTPFSTILRDGILTKLELHDTYFLSYPDNIAIANGYDEALLGLGRRNLTGFRRSLESGAYAAGGILSTSQDMARFVHGLFNGRVLSDSSLAEMETFLVAPDEDIPEQTGYGLGIRHLVIDDQSLIGHTGSIPGFSGIVMHHAEKNYTIAILSNLSTIGQTRLLAEIQRIILKYESR
jgi:D-alanyl-D-alanine carboxypeptidase